MSNPTGSTTMAEQQTWSKLASLFPGPFVPFVPAPGAPPQHVPFPASLCQDSWEPARPRPCPYVRRQGPAEGGSAVPFT